MKFALINDDKTEAVKGAKGFCPSCGSELVAKCGEIYVNHWAHKGKRNCDPWWENETEWHRSWKGKFPVDWQEVVHFDSSGEKHIADVKTENGWAIEFQHSYLKPEERRSRNSFYSKLIWVVDGLRRKTDRQQFQKVVQESTVVNSNLLLRRVYFPEECRLLREWQDKNTFVFFDFKDDKAIKQLKLWFLFPKISTDEAYLMPFSRVKFVELLSKNEFDKFVRNIVLPIRKIIAERNRIDSARRIHTHTNRLLEFERYLVSRYRKKRRF